MTTSHTNPINIPNMRNSTSPRDNQIQVTVNGDDDFGHATPMSYTPAAGAIPITSMRAPRRESLAGGSGSLMTGISWGPGSVSSFLGRDDIAMQGTSPYIGHDDIRSPQFMESYMPRLEETYMTGFKCCNTTLDSMHELLRHFEEKHAGESAFAQSLPSTSPAPDNVMRRPAVSSPSVQVQPADTLQRPALAPSRAQQAHPSSVQTSIGVNGRLQQQQHQQLPQQQQLQQQQPSLQQQLQQQQISQASMQTPVAALSDLENLEDLDMEGLADPDPLGLMNGPLPNGMNGLSPGIQQAISGQTTPTFAAPNLSINPSAQYRFPQNIRSQPQTPLSGRSLYGTNPTVSSVNTPSLMANPLQALQRDSPQSSNPGTPAEPDPEMMASFGTFGFNPALQNQLSQHVFNRIGTSTVDNDTIDNPGTRLTSPTMSKQSDTQDEVHQKLGLTQYGPESETAKNIRLRQLDAGMQDQDQPYLCPVIGCSKGYKNSNGLRYHKQHGHKNQRLADNGDGTFSICDDTGKPYEGTEGMARAKPFACKTCGRRYKNANGLKYHYLHSEGCMPEGHQANISDNANVAGAGIGVQGSPAAV